MRGALPNILLSAVGTVLLMIGILDERRSDATASALLMLGSGILVLGVLLSRLSQMDLSATGFKLTLLPHRDNPSAPSGPAGPGKQRPPMKFVALAVTASVLLLAVGAAARSALDPNYRVLAVDPRPEPCSSTLTASPEKGVRKAPRVPSVVGLDPDKTERKLRRAQLTVERLGDLQGECVVASQSRDRGVRLRPGQTMAVRFKEKPPDQPPVAPVQQPPPAPGKDQDNDQDNDHYNTEVSGGTDCNDDNSEIHPGRREITGDGIDQDCKEGDATAGDTDADGDGRLDETDNCDEVSNPNQADLDNDKKGDACDEDADGDGFLKGAGAGTDCNDENSEIHPGRREITGDGIDQDCDGVDSVVIE